MSQNLLLDERPLVLLPNLACLIGVEEAIVLQQIHFLCISYKCGKILDDGEKYVWNTYEDWQEECFPFWSVSTIQRKFSSLEKLDLIISKQPNAKKYDHTKYYRINRQELEKIQDRITHNETTDDVNLICSDDVNLTPSLKEAKTSSKTSYGEEEAPTNIITHFERKRQSALPVEQDFTELKDLESIVSIRKFYPTFHPRTLYQHELLETITNLPVWSETVKWWSGRGYKAQNIEGMVDKYNANLQVKTTSPKGGGNYLTAEMIAQMENEPIN